MSKFKVNIMDKNNKKNTLSYNPVCADKMEAYSWGERQAKEFGINAKIEVLEEIVV